MIKNKKEFKEFLIWHGWTFALVSVLAYFAIVMGWYNG